MVSRVIGLKSLKKELKLLREVMPDSADNVMTKLAFGTQGAMRQRLRETQAVTGRPNGLIRAIQPLPVGNTLVVRVIGADQDNLLQQALAVDMGLQNVPNHIVRVDIAGRKSRFEQWARRTGRGDNLTETVGPWLAKGWHGKFFLTTLDYKGPIYLNVGNKSQSILNGGVHFFDAGEKYLEENIDKQIEAEIDSLLKIAKK